MTRLGQARAGVNAGAKAAALVLGLTVFVGLFGAAITGAWAAQPQGTTGGNRMHPGALLAPLDPRVVVPQGARVVVVPVRGVGSEPVSGLVSVGVPSGGQIEARLVPVDLIAPVQATEAESWSALIGRWHMSDSEPQAGSIRRDWLLVIDAARLDGQTVVTLPGDAHFSIFWAGDTSAGARVLAGAAALVTTDAPGEPPTDRARSGALLAPALDAPAERWRARALARALGTPSARVAPSAGPGVVRDADAPADAFEALGEQIEAAWLDALARLSSADDALAARVAGVLVRCVRFEQGVLAPLWPAATASDVRLATLLDPRADPEAMRIAARAWLDAQPPGLVWVIDDAGRPLRDGEAGEEDNDDAPARRSPVRARVRAAVGLANLTGAPAVAWLNDTAPDEGNADMDVDTAVADEPVVLAAHGTAVPDVLVRAPVRGGGGAGVQPAVVRIRLGQVETAVGVRASPLPVMPPGATIGPLLQDWSAASLLLVGGSAATQPFPPSPWRPGARADSWLTAARLTREGDAWVLLVQCNFEADAPVDAEVLEVWLGAHGAGGPLRISPVAPGEASGTARVHRSGAPGAGVGSWWATIPVPASAIEPDGTLRVGLVRTDARAVRSAWPRAMLPWQAQPGRAALDVSAWDGGGP